MPNLIGTAPNQVPTNGALGNMAFQNKEAVSVDTLVTTGNVGIGTSSPTANLEVNAGGPTTIKNLNSSWFTSGTNSYFETDGIFSFRNTSATERMRISAAGSVSIGTTTTPGALSVSANGTDVALVSGVAGAGYFGVAGAKPIIFESNATERMRIDSAGNVGIGTTSPTAKLDVNADTVRVRTAKTPASATATGNAGDICWDSNYVYVCVATNTWKRSALSTW